MTRYMHVQPHELRLKLGLTGLFVVVLALAFGLPSTAFTNDSTGIEGVVVDARTGLAIPNASIDIPILGLSTSSNGRGEFSWSGMHLASPTPEAGRGYARRWNRRCWQHRLW